MRARGWCLAAVASLVVACLPACITKTDDGGSCSEDKDCKSDSCRSGACRGSACGDDKSVCLGGWKCLHYDADPISGFFGSDGSDICTATCGHCPQGTYCPSSAKPDVDTCVVGTQPLTVTIAPDSATAGQPVHIVATLDPPGDVKTATWNFGDGPAETTTTASVDHTWPQKGSFLVSVDVEDTTGRKGSTTGQMIVQ